MSPNSGNLIVCVCVCVWSPRGGHSSVWYSVQTLESVDQMLSCRSKSAL
jgi:hypothetical protein